MPQPITLYKGTETAHNIYLSELQSWLDLGWSREPQPEEKPAKKTTSKKVVEPEDD